MKTEKHFKVTWIIDSWAATPEEAIAKAILKMPVPANEDSIATFFDVEDKETKEKVTIDTLDMEEEETKRFVKVLDRLDDEEEVTPERIEEYKSKEI